jgi:hypothetical protein
LLQARPEQGNNLFSETPKNLAAFVGGLLICISKILNNQEKNFPPPDKKRKI